jgi:hypothetical protein
MHLLCVSVAQLTTASKLPTALLRSRQRAQAATAVVESYYSISIPNSTQLAAALRHAQLTAASKLPTALLRSRQRAQRRTRAPTWPDSMWLCSTTQQHSTAAIKVTADSSISG